MSCHWLSCSIYACMVNVAHSPVCRTCILRFSSPNIECFQFMLNVTCIAIIISPAVPRPPLLFPPSFVFLPYYAGLTQHPVFHISLSYLNCSIEHVSRLYLIHFAAKFCPPFLSPPPSVPLPFLSPPPTVPLPPPSSMIVKSFSPIHQGRPSGMLLGPNPLSVQLQFQHMFGMVSVLSILYSQFIEFLTELQLIHSSITLIEFHTLLISL